MAIGKVVVEVREYDHRDLGDYRAIEVESGPDSGTVKVNGTLYWAEDLIDAIRRTVK